MVDFGKLAVLVQGGEAHAGEIELLHHEILWLLDDGFKDVHRQVGEVFVFRRVVQRKLIFFREHEHGDPIAQQPLLHAKGFFLQLIEEVDEADFALFGLFQKLLACIPSFAEC